MTGVLSLAVAPPNPDTEARPGRQCLPGTVVLDGKYRLVKELRSGNQARAFRGVRVVDSEVVFIKILQNPTLRRDYFAKLNVLREKILAVDHPNLLRCYDFDADGDAWIEVYEFAEGQTLSEMESISPSCRR